MSRTYSQEEVRFLIAGARRQEATLWSKFCQEEARQAYATVPKRLERIEQLIAAERAARIALTTHDAISLDNALGLAVAAPVAGLEPPM